MKEHLDPPLPDHSGHETVKSEMKEVTIPLFKYWTRHVGIEMNVVADMPSPWAHAQTVIDGTWEDEPTQSVRVRTAAMPHHAIKDKMHKDAFKMAVACG